LITRVDGTQVVIIAVNRGIVTTSCGFVTGICGAEIVVVTKNREGCTISVNTSFCRAEIIVFTYNRMRNTKTRIHVTVVCSTKIVVFAHCNIIFAARTFVTVSHETGPGRAEYFCILASFARVTVFLSTCVAIITGNISVFTQTVSLVTSVERTDIIIITVNGDMGTISSILITRRYVTEIVIVTVFGSRLTAENWVARVDVTWIIVITKNRVVFTSRGCNTDSGLASSIRGTSDQIIMATRIWKTIVISAIVIIIANNYS
jgi:hypothetical protein